nr:ATP-binding protein [Halovenus rubra]
MIEVLCIDGDTQILTEIRKNLEEDKEQFNIRTVTSTAKAWDVLGTASVNCLVSEYGLSDNGRFGFVRELRGEGVEVPYLFFTDTALNEIVGDAFSAGVTDCVRKGTTQQYTILANRIETVVAEYRAQKRYDDEKHRRKQMLDRLFDGYVRLNEELEFIAVNESAASFIGLSREEILGEQYDKDLMQSGNTTFYDAYREGLATGERQVIEGRSGLKQNTWVQARIYPTDDGLSVYFRDITEQKDHESKLKEKNERLEQFARIVSHDLRNPLNVAQLRLELAMDDSDNPHLEDIKDAHDRIESIVEETLILTKQDEQIGERESVDLNQAVEGWWNSVATENTELVVNDPPTVQTSPERLRHVFENLFKNADTHAGKNTVIEVGSLDDGFYIADNGPGIPDDLKDELFDFGVTGAKGGTGYGLAIVKEIIDAHGWNINIERHPTDTPHTVDDADYTLTGACFCVTGVDIVS